MGIELVNNNVSDIIATSMYSRRKDIADGISNNIALLKELQKDGNTEMIDGEGGFIEEALFGAENDTAMYYSGYQTLDTSPQQTITAARYNLSQAAAMITMSGLEELQNSGSAKFRDLLKARILNAIYSVNNLIGAGVYSDGSGGGGTQIGGMQLLVSKTPATGTVGGIDAARPSAAKTWRNVAYSASANGFTVNATTITQIMHLVWNQLVRGIDCPNLLVADNNYFTYYQQSLDARQRVADASDGNLANFTGLKFLKSSVILDGGVSGACPVNTMYFLNTKFLKYRPHKDRNVVAAGGRRQSVNQDATVVPVFWAGQLTCNLRRLQGVLFA